MGTLLEKLSCLSAIRSTKGAFRPRIMGTLLEKTVLFERRQKFGTGRTGYLLIMYVVM